MDEIDRSILQILQHDGRISNAELGRRINLSPPAVHARLKRLEEEGFIRRYAAVLDPEKIGFELLCFVHVTLQLHQADKMESVRKAIKQMPEVLECYHVTGEYDFLLKIVAHNRKDLQRFVIEQMASIPGVAHIHTSLVLTEEKTTTEIPLL